MKIKGTQQIELTISDAEKKRITIETIKELAGWPKGAYVTQGCKLIQTHYYNGSHAFAELNELRDATELDKAVATIIREIVSTKWLT
jgi:hypothetical protein